MEFGLTEFIIAVVTTNKEMVSSAMTPVFYARDEEHKERLALLIAKTTRGMVHDLESGTYIIVKH
ncbi:capping complex subunit for YIEGIA [Alkaliphilus crotonatoxidans]